MTSFDDYLEKKLQDPKFKALYKRDRNKLGKEINKARKRAGKKARVPLEVRRAYSKVKSALSGKALACESWWTKPLPFYLGNKSPQEHWKEGNTKLVMSLLRPTES